MRDLPGGDLRGGVAGPRRPGRQLRPRPPRGAEACSGGPAAVRPRGRSLGVDAGMWAAVPRRPGRCLGDEHRQRPKGRWRAWAEQRDAGGSRGSCPSPFSCEDGPAMTRRVRLVVAVASAVLLLSAFAVAQATDYARQPLIPAIDHQADLDAVAKATGCGDLRATHQQHYQVWKQAVKKHDAAEDQAHEAMMRATLLRLAALEQQGRCGG